VCLQRKLRVNNTEDVTNEINEDLEYTNSISLFQNQLKSKNKSSKIEDTLPTPRRCKSMFLFVSKFKGPAPIVNDTTPITNDTIPITNDTTLIVSDTTSIANDTTSVDSDTIPITDDAIPTIEIATSTPILHHEYSYELPKIE
jgi:hypothetical protein